jgi:hypothetical protein
MKLIKSFITALILTAVASSTYAANVHLKGALTVKDLGDQLKVCGALAGLGNCDITLTVTVNADITTSLKNPAGKVVPGHSVQTVVTGETTISSTEIKNGNVSFCVTTDEVATPTWQEAGAPNKNWKVIVEDVDFSGATLTVEQCGQTVLQKSL